MIYTFNQYNSFNKVTLDFIDNKITESDFITYLDNEVLNEGVIDSIKDLALQKKKAEAIDKWATEKIVDTYIKINDKYESCKFESNWRKL